MRRLGIVWELISRFYANLYGWTITVFYIWQGLLICAVTHGWLGKDVHGKHLDVDDMLTASLTIAVYVVVLLNTIGFLRGLSPVLSTIFQCQHLSRAEKSMAKDCYDAFLIGLVAATFFAGILALLIGLCLFAVIDTGVLPWKTVLKINEWSSLFIFCIFLFADWMGYRACKLAFGNEQFRKSAKYEAVAASLEELKLAIVAVDVPGLLGLAFIVVVSYFAYPEYIRFDYWHGFVAGAIAFHVAFSQSSLALLAARHSRRKGTDNAGVMPDASGQKRVSS
jgi:hypothetical protein